MTVATSQGIDADQFARTPSPIDGSRQELVRGSVITMPPPDPVHGLVQAMIAHVLIAFSLPRKCGSVITESGIITETSPDTVRAPDVAYWSADRLPPRARRHGYPSVVPNLCVEVLSPSNTPSQMRAKIKEYCFAGVSLVWVVDPDARTVEVYRSPDRGERLWGDERLTCETVIPGFECKVSDFFQTLDNEDS